MVLHSVDGLHCLQFQLLLKFEHFHHLGASHHLAGGRGRGSLLQLLELFLILGLLNLLVRVLEHFLSYVEMFVHDRTNLFVHLCFLIRHLVHYLSVKLHVEVLQGLTALLATLVAIAGQSRLQMTVNELHNAAEVGERKQAILVDGDVTQ